MLLLCYTISMVKLLQQNGRFLITVPKDKVKRKKWKGGEEFDVEFDQNGNLTYIQFKK